MVGRELVHASVVMPAILQLPLNLLQLLLGVLARIRLRNFVGVLEDLVGVLGDMVCVLLEKLLLGPFAPIRLRNLVGVLEVLEVLVGVLEVLVGVLVDLVDSLDFTGVLVSDMPSVLVNTIGVESGDL